jgi:hypothetical protein
VTSSMAAAAEAMRTRRNIGVLLLRERKAADTCTSHRTAGCPKPRARELRALDLDQSKPHVHLRERPLLHPLHSRGYAAIGVSCRDATGTNTMAETLTIDRPDPESPRQSARRISAAPRLQPDPHRQARNRRRDPAARRRFPAQSEPRCLLAMLAARAALPGRPPAPFGSLLCQRRLGLQRDCSIRHSLRTKKQVSVIGIGT